MRFRRHGQSDRPATPVSTELPKWATMRENTATRVLQDGQKEGRVRACDLRSADDGSRCTTAASRRDGRTGAPAPEGRHMAFCPAPSTDSSGTGLPYFRDTGRP